ncbi:replication initiation protein [Holzapfeliella floricola]|uniref:replication initiation protein n=1 Tax=Holzapfeliella floricola TaxID=679249 RepID=UPI0007857FA4|nr:replication initiation protein [Holzapfeliella floricola]
MVNEIVKYGPELNTIPLKGFTSVEMNLFFSIVSRMRDKGNQMVRFPFSQLKDLSDYKATANNRFIDDVEQTYNKLMSLRFGRRSQTGLTREFFVMFTDFKISGETKEPYVDVKIHEKALPLLNDLDTWVRYSLMEFRDIRSTYAKTVFRLLKQFRTTGYLYLSKEDFIEALEVPKSYRQTHIDKRIIEPVLKELSPIFRNLKFTKKHGSGRGRPVVGYQFTFTKEARNADDFEIKKVANVESEPDWSKVIVPEKDDEEHKKVGTLLQEIDGRGF